MRQESGSVPNLINTLITSLFITNTSNTTLQKLWTDRATAVYSNLSFTDLADYLNQSPDGQEILAGSAPADFIACNLPNLDNEVGEWTNFTCIDCYCPTPGTCYSSFNINPDEEDTIPTLPTTDEFYQDNTTYSAGDFFTYVSEENPDLSLDVILLESTDLGSISCDDGKSISFLYISLQISLINIAIYSFFIVLFF
jgi:hypothetical protein